jgi:peroxin-5
MYGMNMGQNMFQGLPNVSVDQDKGKGKSREADFEAAFAHYSTSLPPTQTESSRIVEVDADVTEEITDAMKNTTLDSTLENTNEIGAEFKPCVRSCCFVHLW